ncbi:hypothetical protein V8G54_030205 [Vigna mungo]|uniref:Uncharacterized protein n=1 Tax=Vigna mungo TaxID=3915 RepID=A0AAQ3MWL6_VIGMU
MEMELYKEVVAQSQVAVLVYYSRDHAILDMLAGHTHGFPVAAGEPEGVGMEQLMMVECGMEVEADGAQDHHMGEVHDGHREQLVAAQLADNKVLVAEDLFVYWLFDFGFQLMGSCC